jgi:hypothetical protein
MVEGLSEYVAERYEPGATRCQIEADAGRLAAAAAGLQEKGERIEFLGSTFMPGDEASFSWFRSSSAQLVETAHAEAEVPLERVVLALALPNERQPGGSVTQKGVGNEA